MQNISALADRLGNMLSRRGHSTDKPAPDDGVSTTGEGSQTSPNTAGHTGDITREDLELPKCFKGRLAFVLHNVLSKQECKTLIERTEKMGYVEALVMVGAGRQVSLPDTRNSSRCIWDTPEESDKIWQRIKEHIPESWRGHSVIGINERLRFLRYKPGEYFKPHLDGVYKRDTGERSFITIQAYLNEGFKGGSTTFMNYAEEERIEVVPKTGMVLVFQHDIMHEGSVLEKGRKYSVRSDVMYSADITPDK